MEDKNNDIAPVHDHRSHSKFPGVIVIPLKDLSAKATRDGLIEIFMHTGLLEVIFIVIILHTN